MEDASGEVLKAVIKSVLKKCESMQSNYDELVTEAAVSASQTRIFRH